MFVAGSLIQNPYPQRATVGVPYLITPYFNNVSIVLNPCHEGKLIKANYAFGKKKLRLKLCDDIIRTELKNYFKKRKDIINGPKYFGDHTDCEKYYCRGSKQGEENLIPILMTSHLFTSIMEANRKLGNHASSLIYDVDMNAAETFNSIVAKFISGERINYCLKNSSLSYNAEDFFQE
ncbi:hypothetical protein RN001_005691 [Aquatica leii]|uniref:Uncharacterized protein n=1 Tax=Aquatica leii TaxID=1421715 RepID=A0AAN7PC76_9COLE|nr:hypothetical protein RN001_005691 [Aquatica leii]